MMRKIEGGCLCGAVRYTGEAAPIATFNCHCRDCQRAHGAPFNAGFLVPRAAVVITGTLTWHESRGDSGLWVRRAFCPTCGSRLLGLIEAAPDLLDVAACSLDDGAWFRPEIEMYTSSAREWTQFDPKLPRFPKMPPMG